MKNLIFTLVMICFVYGALGAKRIAFLEDPTVPDQQVGLVAALTGEGYTVDISYTPFDFTALGGYDLVIVSRGISSGDFSDAPSWNALTVPVFVLSPFAARDSRLKLIQGAVVNPADAGVIDSLVVTNGVPLANDAVFDGVTTGGAPFEYFKGSFCYLDYYLADWESDGNTGTPLVVVPDDATDGAGSVLMARWNPGVEAYPGSGILAGRRSYMDIGTDFNMDNYTDASLKLFLNETAFLMDLPIIDGVQNLKSEAQLKVYPIPSADGRFTIEMKGSKLGMANVRIYTMTGMQVYDKNVGQAGNISVNSGLTKGMYLLQVSADGNKSSQKIVIE